MGNLKDAKADIGSKTESNRNEKSDLKNDCRTTVVIPNFNGIKYLSACLDSIAAGTVQPAVIVVDNASSDKSAEEAAKKYPWITLIPLKENTGFSHAVNVGIQAADTEFIFLLNNDTAIDACCIKELEAVMDQSGNIFSAGAKMINMKNPEKIDDAGDFYSALGWAFARGKDKPATNYHKSDRVFAACAGAAIYRRELFEEIGLFDEEHFAYLEDIDIGYRANILGYRNVFAPKAIVAHAGSGVTGSRHNEVKVRLSSRNSIYLIYKNMPLLQIILNLPFLFAGYLIKIAFFLKKRMGKTYVLGLIAGFRLSFSAKGRKHKVNFHPKNLSAYVWIQLELWMGIIRRVF